MPLLQNFRAHWVRPALFFGNNPISLAGGAITTASGITMIGYWLVELFGKFNANPYLGIIFFLIAAAFLIPTVVSILMPVFWFVLKTGFLLFVWIWIRGTLPRFRYDQLMGFTWKFLFPAAVVNLLVTGLMVALFS